MDQNYKNKKVKRKKVANAKDILMSNDWLTQREKSAKYVSKEYQDYGLRLATKLQDPDHKALYIKLAKVENRALVTKALSFADDYPSARNKARVFMWKLKELKSDLKKKREEEAEEEKEKQLGLL